MAEQEVQAVMNAGGSLLPTGLPAPPNHGQGQSRRRAGHHHRGGTSHNVSKIADEDIAQKISQLTGVGLVSLAGRPSLRPGRAHSS